MFTSMFEINATIFSLKSVISFDTLSDNSLTAIFLVSSVSELIKSITPSASVKSIRPFKNALLVNSPGSANLQPDKRRISIILFTTAIDP